MNQQEVKKLENKITKNFEQHIKKNDVVVIGVSGGPDSIFSLHMLTEFAKKTQIKIIVAHVNHMLRKPYSDKEEELVQTFVENLSSAKDNKKSIIFCTKKSDISKLSKNSKEGIEETGRKVRYDFFNKLAKKHKASHIITAHHADDNLETIISNLSRGATLQGLSGIQEITKLPRGIHLFRPLLDISKTAIVEYLKHKKIKFCVDKTNAKIIYKRNFIRHKVIPELKKINPNITNTISKNTQTLREISDFLKESANKWITKNNSNNAFPTKSFRELHTALQKTIILEIYKNKVGDAKNIEQQHIEEVLKIINQNAGNKRKKLGKVTFAVRNNKFTAEF